MLEQLQNTKFKLTFAFSFSFLTWVILSASTHAATITVGTDLNPSACTLSAAIVNMNDDTQTNTDCVETGTYGTNDTIIIPEGTVYLDANLPLLGHATNKNDLAIQGAGMGQTIIDGSSQYFLFYCPIICEDTTLTLNNLTLTAFHGNAILMQGGNLVTSRLEIDGNGAVDGIGGTVGGIFISTGNTEINMNISDTHIHSLDTQTGTVLGIFINNQEGGSLDAEINRVTVNNLSGVGVAGIVSMFVNGTDSYGSAAILIRNTTVVNLEATTYQALGVGMNTISRDGSATNDMTIQNSTIGNILGSNNQFFPIPSSGIQSVTFVEAEGDSGANTLNIENVLVFDSESDGSPSNCLVVEATGFGGGAGSGSVTQNSGGGNISSDSTCEDDVFNNVNDQNNIGNLASTLGSLSDNGGYVPTIPLLPGSSAIDSGVDLTGTVDTDARGVARPQLNAYDSGAYEVTQAELGSEPNEGGEDNGGGSGTVSDNVNADNENLADTGQSLGYLLVLSITLVSVSAVQLTRRFQN